MKCYRLWLFHAVAVVDLFLNLKYVKGIYHVLSSPETEIDRHMLRPVLSSALCISIILCPKHGQGRQGEEREIVKTISTKLECRASQDETFIYNSFSNLLFGLCTSNK